jgi:protease I
MAALEGLRVAVLVERGVNEIEFHHTRLRLREAGAEVIAVGSRQLDYEGEDHERLRADATIDQVEAAAFDGVVIPGGLAPEKLRQNPQVIRFVGDVYERGKVCAAICHGQQVLISAGILRGRRAVAAWSMADDLVHASAEHVAEARAIRDGTLVTARFSGDLPLFCRLMWEAFAEAAGRSRSSKGEQLRRLRFGVVADEATNAPQFFYARYRIEEEGGTAIVLGRQAGVSVRLGSPTWEWGERGPVVMIDRALEDVGATVSDDLPYEAALRAIRVSELDGLIIPGGLATWLIRGHPGLQKLIREMDAVGKPIAAIERGPKILLSANILNGRTVTGSPEVRDELIAAGLRFRDEPVIRDEHLLLCRSTDDLPEWGKAWVEMSAKTSEEK